MARPRLATPCLCAIALLWPALSGAEPAAPSEIEPAVDAVCSAASDRDLPRIPVQIVIDQKTLERHQQDEYVVLRNDGSSYREPVFLDTSETAAQPPLR